MTPGPLPDSILDTVLIRQLAVAWAGERCDDRRLAWWDTDLVSPYGGEDVFAEFAPRTARWAAFRSAREAARRADARARRTQHAPDAVVTLFHFGFALDERLDDRLAAHVAAERPPEDALPGLTEVFHDRHAFDRPRLAAWLSGHGDAPWSVAPGGRRLAIDPLTADALPGELDRLSARLVAALAPLADHYPMPHLRLALPEATR